MQKIDVPTLANQLNLLAEVFDKKPVTPRALESWFDALRDFPTERVLSLLIAWPKTHHKFPLIAEVWKACNEMAIDTREDRARVEREINVAPASGKCAEYIASTRKMLEKQKRTAREHWEHVLATAPRGSIGHRYASEIIGAAAREPGQD